MQGIRVVFSPYQTLGNGRDSLYRKHHHIGVVGQQVTSVGQSDTQTKGYIQRDGTDGRQQLELSGLWPQTVEWREAEQGVLKRLWELAQIGHNERNVIENFVQIGIGQAFPAGTGMIPVNGQTGRSYIQG